MSSSLVLKLVIGVNQSMKQPWGLAEVITGEQAVEHFREFLEEYGLPPFTYDPATTVVQITHRDTPRTGMGVNHHYGFSPIRGDNAMLTFDSLQTNIDKPHWDILIVPKAGESGQHYFTLDTPKGLQKLWESYR